MREETTTDSNGRVIVEDGSEEVSAGGGVEEDEDKEEEEEGGEGESPVPTRDVAASLAQKGKEVGVASMWRSKRVQGGGGGKEALS
jgi:hypothetical protein